jgi:hypothetical protein
MNPQALAVPHTVRTILIQEDFCVREHNNCLSYALPDMVAGLHLHQEMPNAQEIKQNQDWNCILVVQPA